MKLEDVDTRCIADDSLPWLPLAPYAELASVKLLSADPVRGELILVLRAPPGIELPRHRTSGSTTIYTVQGRWKYREHDWVAGPGSLVIEPASAVHTAQMLGDGTDDVVAFLLVAGDMQLLDAENHVTGIESWRSAVSRYLEYCSTHGIEPRDVTVQSRSDDCCASRGAA
ncbi:MAG TPA: 2,4'-dihydroxyacetophenone dioxygenase family protein [Steroidobacteraceae bacterium]